MKVIKDKTNSIINIHFETKMHSFPDSFLYKTKYIDETNFELIVERMDRKGGWDQDLVVRCYDGFFLKIGNSNHNNKEIKVNTKIKINLDDRIIFSVLEHPFPDEFDFQYEIINENSFIVIIKRVDIDSGWGQDLRVVYHINSNKPDNLFDINIGPSISNIVNKNIQTNFKLIKKDCSNVWTSKIPKRIYQTYKSYSGKKWIYDAQCTWVNLNNEFDYQYYSNNDCIEFLKENFDERLIKAYNSLVPGPFKADLWRYCVLYIKGGVYVDIDMECMFPLNNLIDEDDCFIFIKDDINPTLQVFNAFICSIPKHPFLKEAIYSAVDKIERKFYGKVMFEITGPVHFGDCINKFLQKKTFEVGKYYEGDLTYKILEHDTVTEVIKDTNCDFCRCQIGPWAKAGNYCRLWDCRRIYK